MSTCNTVYIGNHVAGNSQSKAHRRPGNVLDFFVMKLHSLVQYDQELKGNWNLWKCVWNGLRQANVLTTLITA